MAADQRLRARPNVTNDTLLFGELCQLVPVMSPVAHAIELVSIVCWTFIFWMTYNYEQ